MRDREIVEFFEKLIKRFYDEDEDFKEYFDDSCQEYIGWNAPYRIPGFEASFETGSERACFKFYSDPYEDLCNEYVVKLGLRWKDGECRQCRREMEAYGKFREIGCEDLVTRIIEGHRIAEVLGLNEGSDARFYIVERADVDEDDYESALFKFVESHEELFIDDLNRRVQYYSDMNDGTFDDLEKDIQNELIWDFCDDTGYGSVDEFSWILDESGWDCTWDSPLRNLLYTIGDFHSANVALTPDGWKIVDFGWGGGY